MLRVVFQVTQLVLYSFSNLNGIGRTRMIKISQTPSNLNNIRLFYYTKLLGDIKKNKSLVMFKFYTVYKYVELIAAEFPLLEP